MLEVVWETVPLVEPVPVPPADPVTVPPAEVVVQAPVLVPGGEEAGRLPCVLETAMP